LHTITPPSLLLMFTGTPSKSNTAAASKLSPPTISLPLFGLYLTELMRGAGGSTTICRSLVAVAAPECLTDMVNLEGPAAVGVAEIKPVAGASLKPGGSAPAETCQE